MAVVQISKIQVRRGQKNSSSGIPQLSSAEFAWAVDSQQLYIGNGSVAEGAPYVGNTRIITEHDNLLEIASSYRFSPSYLAGSVSRSLQGKLDETVSVFDFGNGETLGNGTTDCVAAFKNAFTELFANTDPTYKKVLLIPNGEYLFNSDLTIPSDVILKGETPNGVVLNIGPHNIRFTTTSGLEWVDFNSSNRPRNVNISNLTISRSTGQVVCSGLADSRFERVTVVGDYTIIDTVSNLEIEAAAIFWQNRDDGTRTTNLVFDECTFDSNSISVKGITWTAGITFENNIQFNNCKFFENYLGVYQVGKSQQQNKWKFNNCLFEEMHTQAFRSSNGWSTILENTNFKKCGNGSGNPTEPLYPIVYFTEKNENLLLNCSSDRQQLAGLLGGETSVTRSAITEVYNSDKASFVDRINSTISNSVGARALATFSALNRSFTLRYFLAIGIHSRTGKLTISISDDQTDVAITDEYQYSPSLVVDPGGTIMTSFEFAATLADINEDTDVDTMVLSYKNPLGSAGTLSFDVTYGV